jgi:hypothetical protein
MRAENIENIFVFSVHSYHKGAARGAVDNMEYCIGIFNQKHTTINVNIGLCVNSQS